MKSIVNLWRCTVFAESQQLTPCFTAYVTALDKREAMYVLRAELSRIPVRLHIGELKAADDVRSHPVKKEQIVNASLFVSLVKI